MARLALIGGHSVIGVERALAAERLAVDTERGPVTVLEGDRWLLLQRHGIDRYLAPHAIDHRANLLALRELSCDRVLALGSVGSLHSELPPGTVLSPDDFIALHIGLSYSDGAEGHRVPGFDARWRELVLKAWRRHAKAPLREGGVYWQTVGPRFESPAEIRLLAAHADVVGMTLASECVLAAELGIAYAAVCVIDNLANGVAELPLSAQAVRDGAERNREHVVATLRAVLPELTA